MALKYSKATSFSLRNATKANLEKSSTIASTYLLPPMLCVLIGPMRSMCNSFSGLIVWSLSNFLWNLFTCFFFFFENLLKLNFQAHLVWELF